MIDLPLTGRSREVVRSDKPHSSLFEVSTKADKCDFKVT